MSGSYRRSRPANKLKQDRRWKKEGDRASHSKREKEGKKKETERKRERERERKKKTKRERERERESRIEKREGQGGVVGM